MEERAFTISLLNFTQTYRKGTVYLEIKSDLIFVHKNQNGEWVRCGKGPVVGAVKTAARDFERWLALSNMNDMPDFDVWLRNLPAEEKSAAIIKIHVENENFILGKLNVLTDRVTDSLKNPDNSSNSLTELIKEFRNLAIDIMLGDSRREIIIQQLNTIIMQVDKLILIDGSIDKTHPSHIADSLISIIDIYINQPDANQSFSLIESALLTPENLINDNDSDLDSDNASIQSMVEETSGAPEIEKIRLITKLIENEKDLSLVNAEAWWSKIQNHSTQSSDKHQALNALLQYINKCSTGSDQLDSKKTMLMRLVGDALNSQSERINHLLSPFCFYQKPLPKRDSNNTSDKTVRKPFK